MLDDSYGFVQCLHPPCLWNWGSLSQRHPSECGAADPSGTFTLLPGPEVQNCCTLGSLGKSHLEVPLPLMTMTCSNSLHSCCPLLMGCEKAFSSGGHCQDREHSPPNWASRTPSHFLVFHWLIDEQLCPACLPEVFLFLLIQHLMSEIKC